MWRPEDTALPLPTDVPHGHNIKKQKKQLPAIISYDSQLIFHYINT